MSEVDNLIQRLNSLHIEEAKILKDLESARARESSVRTSEPTKSVRRLGEFRSGDRVALKTVRPPYTGPNERRALVTGVEDNKVHIRTLSGRETWRKPKNLTLLL